MFGVDYYPEHWPRHRWKSDASLMKKAGLRLVRLAEFAWEKIEPDDGVFDFSWLDEAVDVLSDAGLRIVLGTPTAAPPAWLVEKHPNILPVRRDGTRLGFGGRHHNCHSNEIYRDSVEIIVRAMAGHYRENPAVVGWQIDNELGNSHHDLCHCDSCRYHFHAWLQRKYGTIDALNEAWGTIFWSQTYTHFAQIPLPVATPNSHNPALLLDWRRFASDLIVDYQRIQVAILREECPNHFITHNFMGFFGKVDYYTLAQDLDFVSHDQYPLGFSGENGAVVPPHRSAMPLDFIRGIKHTRFWIMEQQAGPSGWETIGPTPRPGQLRLWAAQSVARGAQSVLFFRWRTALFGTEQYWHGILPHSGDPGRRYEEVRRTVGDLDPVLDTLSGGEIRKSRVAFLFSYDQMWTLAIQPHHPELTYLDYVRRLYEPFHRRNVEIDFVGIHDELAEYDLVVAPIIHLVDDDIAAKLRAYVEQGGRLVSGIRAGIKDWNNRVLAETPPGPFGRLFGIQVNDYDALRGVHQAVRFGDLEEAVSCWADVIDLHGAEVLASYTRDFYAETPAITACRHDAGAAYYLGTVPGPAVAEAFVECLLEEAGIVGVAETPEGVEAVVRSSDRTEVLFLMNHTDHAQIVPAPESWEPLLVPENDPESDGADEDLVLPAFDIALFSKGEA